MYSDGQNRLTPLPENHVSYEWALLDQGTPIKWNTGDPAARTLFAQAVSRWESASSQLDWEWTDSKADANVYVFFSRECRQRPSATGSFLPTEWTPDAVRSANYWRKAELCIRSESTYDATLADNFLSGVAAHEAGHAYGFGELYRPLAGRDTCNPNVDSVMDGAYKSRNILSSWFDKYKVCDGDTPTGWDIGTVGQFFSEGGPSTSEAPYRGTSLNSPGRTAHGESSSMRSRLVTCWTAKTTPPRGFSSQQKTK